MRWLVIQVIVVCVLALIYLFSMGKQAAGSVLVGGGIGVLGNYYFIKRVFRHSGARQAKQILKAFCFGELEKLVIYGVLFAIAVVVLPLAILPLIVGFAACLLIFWVAAFVSIGS